MAEGILPPIVVELIAKAGEFKSEMGKAAAEVKATEGKMAGSMGGIQKVGKAALLGVVGGAVLVGVESVKMAAEFQKSTNLLVTAAGESKDAVKDSSGKIIGGLALVRDGIKNVATETGTSIPQLTEGMYEVEKAGIRGADGIKVLKAAAQGAAEEGANLSTVTNAMTSVMAGYGLKADKSVQVMNALKTAAGGTKDTMQNFASSLSAVLPIAAAAHLDFAQVGGAIATMTQSGMSAQQASQNLANTISSLQAAGKVATKTMQQFGISSVDLSKNLGTKGVGGTLQYLVDTIGHHLGPSGLVMIDTFKRAQTAGQDMSTMVKSMPPALQTMSQHLMNGSMTIKAYAKATSALPPQQSIMAHQFATLMRASTGFSDALKSGSPQATTMTAVLKQMLGGQTGLATAFKLTGTNQEFLNKITKRTGESLHDSAKDVEGWDSTSKLLSIQMAKLHQSFNVILITIGEKLIPIIESAASWFEKHKTVVEALAIVVGGALVIAIGTYVVSLVTAAATSVVAFGSMAIAAASSAAFVIASFMPIIIAMAPIVLAIAAIGIAAYELYKHWDAVWGFIKNVAKTAWDWIDSNVIHPIEHAFGWVVNQIKAHWDLIVGILLGPIGFAVAEIIKHWDGFIGFFKGIPGKLAAIGSGMWDFIKDSFKSAINWVIGGWNGLRFSIPSIHIPMVGDFGGGSFGVPQIPYLAKGGDVAKSGWAVVGDNGPELLELNAGARVTPLSKASANAAGGMAGGNMTVVIPVQLDGQTIARVVAPLARNEMLRMGRGMSNIGLA